MTWDEKDDVGEHPSWCFCDSCREPPEDETSEDWLVRESCEYVERQITLMTETVKKANRTPMIRTSNSGARVRNGLPYLKNENLSGDKQRANIIDAQIPDPAHNKFQNVVILKVELGGRRFLWGLKDKNPCLDALVSAFTDDEKKWAGREFWIFLEKQGFDESAYARVEPIQKEKAGK